MDWLATAAVLLAVTPVMGQDAASGAPEDIMTTTASDGLSPLAPVCAQPPALPPEGAPLEPPSVSTPPATEACPAPPPPPVRPPAPDVFSSVALPVGATSLSLRWMQVRAMGLGEGEGASVYILSRARQQEVADQIWMINDWVNQRVAYVADAGPDQWAAAPETLLTGKGDCEDMAIAKMALLKALGVPEEEMFLLVVRDVYRKIDHAVLAVRRPEGMLILDSRTNRILRAEQVSAYRPTFAYSGPFAWTYGYRFGGASGGGLTSLGQPRR
jgi:predicted transglutaminase-like cysteine proteinase